MDENTIKVGFMQGEVVLKNIKGTLSGRDINMYIHCTTFAYLYIEGTPKNMFQSSSEVVRS